MAKPSAEFVAGVLATWFSGGVAVPLALSYPETELLHVMHDSVRQKYPSVPTFSLFIVNCCICITTLGYCIRTHFSMLGGKPL